jgi:hypothetical protein
LVYALLTQNLPAGWCARLRRLPFSTQSSMHTALGRWSIDTIGTGKYLHNMTALT